MKEEQTTKPLSNTEHSRRRMASAFSSLEQLNEYYEFFLSAREKIMKQRKAENKLSKLVAERAFEAECHFRLLLSLGIESLNEVRYSGMLEASIRKAVELFPSKQGLSDFNEMQKEAFDKIKRYCPDADISMLDKGVKLLMPQLIDIKSDGKALHIKKSSGEGQYTLILEPKPRPGHIGRVDVDEFFGSGPAQTSIMSTFATMAEDTCHHKQWEMRAERVAGVVDVYGSAIATLAWARESFYRHARRTDEVGLGAFEGRDGVVIAIIVAAIVGLIFVVGGVATDCFECILVGVSFLVGAAAMLLCALTGAACTLFFGPIGIPIPPL